MAALKSTVAKVVYSILAAGLVFLLGSWTTNQTWKQNLDGYKNYTIDQVVSNVLNEKDGIADQIAEVKIIVLQIKNEQHDKNDADYKNWIADIEKYYSWCGGSKDKRLDPKFVDKMSNYWKVLPEYYKTDVVKLHYQYAMEYISNYFK